MSEARTDRVAAFYAHAGQRLIQSSHYPDSIHEHLVDEQALVNQMLKSGAYSAVIEVGCMHGCLHFEAIASLDVKYLGIDIVPASINAFQQHLREEYSERSWPRALLLDVVRLREVTDRMNLRLRSRMMKEFRTPAHAAGALAAIEYPALDVSRILRAIVALAGRADLLRSNVYLKIHVRVEPEHIIDTHTLALQYMILYDESREQRWPSLFMFILSFVSGVWQTTLTLSKSQGDSVHLGTNEFMFLVYLGLYFGLSPMLVHSRVEELRRTWRSHRTEHP